MIPLFLVSLVVGLVVGVLAGLLGIGGGMLLVPAFKLCYAMDSLMCTATSLFTIIPTSISGAVSHIRNKTCLPKLGVAAGLGAALSPDWAVMGAAALIIAYSSVTMFRKALKAPKATKPVASSSQPDASALSSCHPERSAAGAKSKDLAAVEDRAAAIERAHLEAPAIGWREAAIGAAIGLFAGLASGYVGVGGGFIMVPLMLSLVGISMKQASGTSLIAVMLLAIPGTIEQGLLGNIDYMAGIAVAVGSIPGAVIGAFVIGICETLIKGTSMTVFSDAFTFALLIVILVVKPTGLFGEKATDKV